MSPRPWPVMLLTALGAWLTAIPFFAVAALLLDGVLEQPAAALILGVLMLGGAVPLLRASTSSLFVENLGVPVLLAGLGLVAVGLENLLQWRGMCGAMSLITLALAPVLPQSWIRALLGAIAAHLALWALSPGVWLQGHGSWWNPWVALHLLVGLWLVTLALTHPHSNAPAPLRALTDIGNGWVASVLLALAVWSGTSFLLGATLSQGHAVSFGHNLAWLMYQGIDLGSILAALLALAGLAWRWPDLRQGWCVGMALIACALSAFMPALGGVLLVASACLITGRHRMAIWAALTALWVIGAFYYQLDWPLTTKALVLAVAGVLLGGLAAWGLKQPRSDHPASLSNVKTPPLRGRTTALALGALSTLLVANSTIWQNETLIRDGRPVFVALTPVDPRSLMQGDYMTLRFQLNQAAPDTPHADAPSHTSGPAHMVFKLDARGLATALRQHQGEALQADELVMRLTRRHDDWLLVTDAFHFKEGEAERWANARFGEFRVNAHGRALLVGLRGAQLEPL